MARSAAASSGIRSDRTHRAIAVPVSGTALLLIDVINDLAFEGSASLVEQTEPMASRLATLKRRAIAAGVPTIYSKDNFGQWRSNFRQTVRALHVTIFAWPSGRNAHRAITCAENDHAMRQIQTVLKGNVAESTRLHSVGRARQEARRARDNGSGTHENRAGQVLRPHR